MAEYQRWRKSGREWVGGAESASEYAPRPSWSSRGRGPRGYRRADARIFEDVCDRLTDDPGIDATDIEVTVQEGEVTLNGTVDDRTAKHRAEDIAESVSGATHVQNNLRVRPRIASRTPGAFTAESTHRGGDQWTMALDDALKSRQPTGA